MSLWWVGAWLTSAAASAEEGPEPPPPDPADVFRPGTERYLERDRRSRSAFRVAAVVGATGAAVEVLGLLVDSRPMIQVGGAAEAIAAPVMTFTSLRSANSLAKLTDTPFPGLAYAGAAAWAIDLAASTTVVADTDLTSQDRIRFAWLALAARVTTYTTAALQQRANNRVRRRIGLRVGPPRLKAKRHVVAFSPWLRGRSGGILFQLSAGGGRGPAAEERRRWTSTP